MNRLLTTILISLMGYCSVLANVTVSGKVVSDSGETLPALVTVLDGSTIKGYCVADDEGYYSVSFESSSPKVILKVALLGFETIEKSIDVKTQRVDIIMGEKNTELKEVVVVADKITQRGDTLSYLVAPYKDEKDRVIGDVIKKCPDLRFLNLGV